MATEPLWSKDKKPVWLEGQENVYLTERGWVIRRPWSVGGLNNDVLYEHLEVAIPGASADVKDDQGAVVEAYRATVTDIISTAGDYDIQALDTITIDVVFDEKVNFTGTPQIATTNSTVVFDCTGYPSARKKNSLRFVATLAGTETDVSDLALAALITLNGGTITDVENGENSELDIAENDRVLTGVNLVNQP